MDSDLKRLEEILRSSEERYRMLVEASPDAIIAGDLDGCITFASPRALELYGERCVSDVLGKSAIEYFAPEDRPKFLSHLQSTLEHGVTRDVEYNLLRADGSLFTGEASAVALRDLSGKSHGFLAVVRDTSARVHADKEIRQRHDELRAIYDGMFDGLMIWDRATWKIVRVNPALCRMLGYSETEVLSLRIMDLHPQDEFPAIQNTIRERVAGRFRGVAAATFLTKDRNMRYVEVASHPITSEGRSCFASFFRDVTERRLAEAALRDSEERLRAICDSAMDAVLMLDSDGKAVFWNPAAEKMFGYTADEILGQDVHAILAPVQHREQSHQAFSMIAVSGVMELAGKTLELMGRRKDGREFPVEMSVSGFGLHGKWEAAAIVRDITERKKARDRLERDRRTLERMLRASDHERQLVAYDIHDGLAQHLAGALMQFDVYKVMKDKSPQQAEAVYETGVTMLRQSHAEARRLISGLRPPILDEYGVVAAITHLIHDLERSVECKIEFHCNVRFSRLSPILENTIYRIVQEGLTNAMKHSGSNRIRVSLLHRADKVRLTIRDWGAGIVLQKKREDQFGLKGIRERARLLGGKCHVHSRPNEGTALRVELPVVEAEQD